MLRYISKYILSVGTIGLMLIATACTKDPGIDKDEMGSVAFMLDFNGKQISLSGNSTKSDAQYTPLEVSTMWIYSVTSDGVGETTDKLIRKYKPANSVPSDLYLAAGKYKVVVDAGDLNEATFTNKHYAGETTFDVVAQETRPVTITCKITNIAVRVEFESTIREKFDLGYEAYVCASDDYSQTDAENGTVPTLHYDTDTTGFFILPDGVNNLSWGFLGESSDPAINKNNSKTGTIELPESGKQYTLKFKYSKTPDGYLTVIVKVQEYVDAFDDSFLFSPEPTVMGDGFNIDKVTGYYSDPIKFNISSINDLQDMKFTVAGDGITYEIMHEGSVLPEAAANGITYTPTDAMNGVLTLTPSFFEKLEAGINSINFEIKDSGANTGKATAQIALAKPVSITSQDLWFGTADLSAVVTNPATNNVTVKYRVSGAGEWTTLPATKGADGYTYTAQATGFKPDKTYEYQLFENGVASGEIKNTTTPAGTQMPNAGFEEWHQSGNPWYPYAEGGSEFWATGNPGSTSLGASYNVTTRQADPRPGSSGQYSAKLQSTDVLIKLAAGNIFIGSFGEIVGTAGTVNMGRAFTFNARPTKLRVWYKGNVGSEDKSRIFVCLTNMTKPGCTYHTVNTKTSEIAKTVLDPTQEFLYTNAQDPSTLEGHILGYGDLLIEQSRGEWTMVEIPINYRKKYESEKPNVLILTASASYRGDYFEGSKKSNLYLDDIEFVYEGDYGYVDQE